jgi:glyoxylase-like metal-dependent hydrolase (beta-lactamase superfamily II)
MEIMQEIESGIYYEDGFPGVTLGALTLPRGTILIDAPLRAEDGRSWRAALLNRGSGIDRIIINLDAHPDRTIGVRSLECPVVAHERTAQVFQNRPPTFKGQNMDVGAEWETCIDLGSARWAIPDMTFSDQLHFHWGDPDVSLEFHPGPAPGASWVVIPSAHVAFIGDAVVSGQPPFLADADIPAWLETLDLLLSAQFKTYVLISGRSGPVVIDDLRAQKNLLKKIDKKLNSLWEKNAPVEDVYRMVPALMDEYDVPARRRELYENRLSHGLARYYNRRIQPDDEYPTDQDE